MNIGPNISDVIFPSCCIFADGGGSGSGGIGGMQIAIRPNLSGLSIQLTAWPLLPAHPGRTPCDRTRHKPRADPNSQRPCSDSQ
jgi:hypothetical protein